MAWNTRGKSSANDEWWGYRHDERNTGEYGTDTRPPGVRASVQVRGATAAAFNAPGDDWYAGTVKRYRITAVLRHGRHRRLAVTHPVAAGRRQALRLPRGTRRVTIRARDDAGNRGRTKVVR